MVAVMCNLGNDALIRYIRAQIQASEDHAIPFERFMHHCLYQPDYGYYMNGTVKIGKQGDFYTSSNIGNVMGSMLANAIVRLFDEMNDSCDDHNERLTIMEWGAGTGRLGVQVLDALFGQREELRNRVNYAIVETSDYHRQLAVKQFAEAGYEVAVWSEEQFHRLASHTPVVIIANELLDAFPVERLRFMNDTSIVRLEQQMVTWNDRTQAFEWIWREAAVELAQLVHDQIVPKLSRIIPGQEFEVNVHVRPWLGRMAALPYARLIIIDYGDVTEELVASHRMQGTLVCYHRHQAHANPLIHVGDQDITAHVDFGLLQQIAQELGMRTIFYGTQKQFLLDAGILEQLQNHDHRDPFSATARRNRAIRQLLLSDQMSELFKVYMIGIEN